MKHLNANYNATTLGPLFDKPTTKIIEKEFNKRLRDITGLKGKLANVMLPQIPEAMDSTTGQQLKEKGIREVSEHNENWMRKCLGHAKVFIGFREGLDFTGEDIRLHCSEWVDDPKHPNAWGALINTLIKRKIIVPTGEHRQMKDRSSHARSTPVYKAAT